MKILITGGMGFVGSHLAEELLKNKHKIIVVSKSKRKKMNLKIFQIELFLNK